MALPLSLLQGKDGFPFANLLLRVGGVALLDHPNRKHKTPLMFLLSKLSSTKSEEQRKKIEQAVNTGQAKAKQAVAKASDKATTAAAAAVVARKTSTIASSEKKIRE